jgi:hypothetical protein
MQLPAEGVVIAVCSMVRLGVGVRGRAHMLKVRFCQWRFIGRQSMPTCPAAAEQNDGDKRRENGPGKVTTVSVGQGEPPVDLLTVIHRHGKRFFTRVIAASLCPVAWWVHCRHGDAAPWLQAQLV